MADRTKIEWTDATWSVVNGCRAVSPGCAHCYACRLAATRLREHPRYAGLAHMTERGPRWTGEVRFHADLLEVPIRWRKPRRIFVANQGDLFHESVTNEQIAAVFGVMAAAPQHQFQVLTKRPERMRRWFDWAASLTCHGSYDSAAITRRMMMRTEDCGGLRCVDLGEGALTTWPLPNVWCGTSVESPEHLHRLDDLLRCPAALHFLSAEPLLAGLDVRPWLGEQGSESGGPQGWVPTGPGLAWVVVGGESGPGARPCAVTWIRSLVRQCKEANTACFVKQVGAHYTDAVNGVGGFLARPPEEYGQLHRRLKHRKGADMAEWPDDLRVRQMPKVKP